MLAVSTSHNLEACGGEVDVAVFLGVHGEITLDLIGHTLAWIG